ncbi:translation elongation factor P [secondary endosymbiont of Heteropsylla cubana]|uniref:Elongation factor P n=1 Tax=secondary endosymbiont of Heteropsylla cubana TaxID=134287 RepID=J3TZ65_9ENTR|nr:elongation factor P [secondary endosymbiont of Heteropsylla cubana]AFP85765.1 translation elongation factor P [secondary endosymbiont of Heteropsylla cubana]
MAFYSTNELRSGLNIILDGEPCTIIENEFVKPGKGQPFNRVRLRKLGSGKVLGKIFKSSELLEAAEVIDINLIYLYNDSSFWYFMNNKTFEQTIADAKVVRESAKWLVEQDQCILTLWNNQPIAVIPPKFVELEVIETDPGLKGDTANSTGKPARLTTGAIVKVPLFVHVGEIIKVDTRNGLYVSRIK